MGNRYRALLQERTDLVAEGKRIFEAAEAENRDLTDEEKARDDAINARLEVLGAEIEREERRRARELTAPAAQASAVREVRDLEAERPFGSLGEQLVAIATAYDRGNIDPRLGEVHGLALGANVALPSDGGFLLQPAFTAGLWQRTYEIGEILQRCFKVPIGDQNDSVKINGLDEDSRATGSRWGGVRAYWVAEGGTLTASMPHFKQIELAPKKLAVLVYATSEMLRSPSTLEAVVNQVVPQEIAFMAEDAIVRGNGAGKPQGLLVSPALISQAAEAGQAAATVVAENISNMWARMWARSRQSAIWLINQEVEPQLDAMNIGIGTGGALVYMPAGGLADAPYGRLKGRPVIPVEYCSALGSLGDIMLIDPTQYAISDRGDIRAASSIHVQFLTDQTAFRFIYEIDGEPLWSAPLTPYQATAGRTLSPFVALAARS